MNVQKVADDANILRAAMPFSFLLRWDEKVCDGTFFEQDKEVMARGWGWGKKKQLEGCKRLDFFCCCCAT